MKSHSYIRWILLAPALGAVILVAALSLTQCADGTPNAAPVGAATSPLAVAQSPLAPPRLPQADSPLDIAPPAAQTAAPVPTYGYRIVAEYPHDLDAFTQGLQFVDGVLYEGTGRNGASSLRRVDLETGEVLQSVTLPEAYFGEGIIAVDDRIIQLTWQSNVGFIYDRESFARQGEFTYPTEGWGITYDGATLLMSDGTSTLYRWDPQTLQEVGRIEVTDQGTPVVRLNELEMVNGEVWANVWQTDRIARIDPATGAVVGWIDLTGLLSAADRGGSEDVLNGIAYDAETNRLFVTGKLWPKLFEIKIVAQ